MLYRCERAPMPRAPDRRPEVSRLFESANGSAPPETEMLRKWLDAWRGLGDVVNRMNRQLPAEPVERRNVDLAGDVRSSADAKRRWRRGGTDAAAGSAGRGVACFAEHVGRGAGASADGGRDPTVTRAISEPPTASDR